MRKTPVDHARMLWKKAADDLIIARLAIAREVALDLVGFHAQQAVEKSLKAILALDDIDYPKTHDIGKLIVLARPLVSEWPFDDGRLEDLSKYAIDVRYDDSSTGANLAQARDALDTAESVHLHAGTMIGPGPHTPDASDGV
jgi:HEPN domain-containing protein